MVDAASITEYDDSGGIEPSTLSPTAAAPPEIPAAQNDSDGGFAQKLANRARGGSGNRLLTVNDDSDYEQVPPGAEFVDPTGNVRRKPLPTVSNDKEFHKLAEGARFVDPEGNEREKPQYDALSYSAQTMYSMAVTPKEKKKILEKFYPGSELIDNEGEYLVNDNGSVRAPGKLNSIPSAAGVAAGNILPIGGGIMGGLAGGTLGGAPAAGGAALGTMGGQYLNDIILKLNGLYDRTQGEELTDKALGAGASLTGDVAGRAIAGFVPSVKAGVSNVTNAMPKVVNKFLGTNADEVKRFREISELGEKPGEGAVGKMGMTASDTTPGISTIAHESPFLQLNQEVFHEKFNTSGVRQKAAESAYNKMGTPLLEKQGVGQSLDDMVSSKPVTPVEATGQRIIDKALEQSGEIDARFAAELARRREAIAAGVAEGPGQREALLRAAQAQHDNATGLINAGLQEIERNADQAVRAAAQGTNSGGLWQAVGTQLQEVRRALGERYRQNSQAAYETVAPGARINARPLVREAEDFIGNIPAEFEARNPSLVRNIRNLGRRVDEEGSPLPATASLEELHNIRSALRSSADWYDLPSDFKNGSLKYFSHQVDNLMQGVGQTPQFNTAVRLLNENDRWFAAERPVFNSREMKTVLRGLEAGEPADPETLFKALVRPGATDMIARTEQVVGPNLWNGVRAAQRQQWLRNARDGQFDNVADAGKFAKEVLDAHNNGTLFSVQGREAGQQLLTQAQQIAALNGKLPITYRPGDTAFDIFRQARAGMEAADRQAVVDPLRVLETETRAATRQIATERNTLKRQDPLWFLSSPNYGAIKAVDRILGDEDLILASAAKFGEGSAEFQALRQVWTERVFKGTLEPGKKLDKINPEVQKIMLGVNLETAQKIAEDMAFIMSGKAMSSGDVAGGMAATSKVTHPLGGKTLSRAARIIPGANTAGRATLGTYYAFLNKVLESPSTARWLEKAYAGGEAHRAMVRQELASILDRGGAMGSGAGVAGYEAQQEQ